MNTMYTGMHIANAKSSNAIMRSAANDENDLIYSTNNYDVTDCLRHPDSQ